MNCCAGFNFPNCNGGQTVTVNGPAGATGDVTLALAKGMLGDKTATLGQVSRLSASCCLSILLSRICPPQLWVSQSACISVSSCRSFWPSVQCWGV